mgnify:CR=1 FL=1
MARHKAGDEPKHYADAGCVLPDGPRSCLACPRALCVLDMPAESSINAGHASRRARIRELIGDGQSWEQIIVALKVSRATISKAVKEGSNG